jgi:hypothetical protein
MATIDALQARYPGRILQPQTVQNIPVSDLRGVIGGNRRYLPPYVMEAIFNNLQPGSVPHMVLQMAICSSFDGLSDLKMWRRKRILDDATWAVVGGRLQLPDSIE